MNDRLALMRKWGVRLAEFYPDGELSHVELFEDSAPPVAKATPTVTEEPAGAEVEAEPVDSDALYASA